MATYVLIHGAGDVGWYWHLVERELRARGHDVVAPDLPCEDDSAGLPEYADAVIDAIGDRGDLVVVSQSFGGFTAPLICDRATADLLVLVAPMIPAPGEAPADYSRNTRYGEEVRESYEDEIELFYQDVPPELAAEALRRGRRQSEARMQEPSPLKAWPDVPTRVLLCRDDRMFPAPFLRRVAQARLGITPDEIDGGHTPALSRPKELVDRLEAYRGACQKRESLSGNVTVPSASAIMDPSHGGEPVMPHEPSIGETRVLLSGLGMGESPRWHDGRLWFSDWGTNEVVAVDLEGNAEVMGEGGGGSGWAVNWLPDGRMIITGADLIRVEPDGSRVRHADLSSISPYGWSEITIDGRSNVFVNSINFDFAEFNDIIASGKAPGKIALVTPDGEAREVASDLAFPNGMVVTPDNASLIVAESFARRLTAFDIAADGTLSNRRLWADVTGDGICIDAEGAVWCSDVGPDQGAVCLRVSEGGEVLDRIEIDRPCYACMLGGEDGRTLFMVAAKWFGPDRIDELQRAKTGQVLTARVAVPHAGWP